MVTIENMLITEEMVIIENILITEIKLIMIIHR
jgi:hypothetical protein